MDLPSETECRFRSGGARPPDGAETCDRSKVHSPASHRVSLRTTRRSTASRGAHGPKLVHANSPAHRATGESPVTWFAARQRHPYPARESPAHRDPARSGRPHRLPPTARRRRADRRRTARTAREAARPQRDGLVPPGGRRVHHPRPRPGRGRYRELPSEGHLQALSLRRASTPARTGSRACQQVSPNPGSTTGRCASRPRSISAALPVPQPLRPRNWWARVFNCRQFTMETPCS